MSRLQQFIQSVRRLGSAWSIITGKGYPLNTIVVFLHTLVSFSLALVAILIQSGFFYSDPMHCVDRSSQEAMPKEHLDVCLQFSKAAGYSNEQGSVDYLHSWTPSCLWALAAILLLPRLAMVCTSTRKARAIFLDEYGNGRPHEEVYQSLKTNLGTFDKLYLKAICIDVWAFIVQLFVVLAINLILLPGKVIPIIMDIPWHRDVEGYTDPISIAFPSFLSCKITPDAHLQGLRGSYYGCYHSMATFYLGLFFVIAIATVMLFLITFLHLVYLVLYLPSPYGRRHLINRGRRHDEINDLPLQLGDLIMLEYGKQYVSGREYADVFKFHSSSQLVLSNTTSSESSSPQCDQAHRPSSTAVGEQPGVMNTSLLSEYGLCGLFTNDWTLVEGCETEVGFVTRENQAPNICISSESSSPKDDGLSSTVVVQQPVDLRSSLSSAYGLDGLFSSDQTLVEGRETEVGFVTRENQVCETAVEEIQTPDSSEKEDREDDHVQIQD